ncbi:MAG: hypothetical protein HY057_05285, partial [Rhodospirillales bacterium]|nr:hypothetical protein [Rhodospirillales bacterium]
MIINRLACADAGPQRRARLAVGLAAGGALLAGVWMGPAFAAPASPPAAPQPIFEIEVKGVIGVASAGYIARGLERARDENAALVVLKLDTPGGLVTSTREIVQAILQSPVPVAVYVAPIGARAASAGTYIAYAAHIAAMAPGTHLGAATPVAIGGPPGLPGGGEPGKDRRDEKGRDEKGGGETEPVGAMERKII